MAIPNYLADVQAAKVKYADAWLHAHHDGDPRRLEWIKLFATDLHAKDPKVNLNGKRGNPNDLSADAINILCEAADSAGRTPEGFPCVVVDVIGGAGGPNPTPTWSVFTTLVEGSGAAVTPTPPAPPPAPFYPYPDEPTYWKRFQDRMKSAYASVGRLFPDPNDPDAYRRFSRCGYDCRTQEPREMAHKHIKELRQELGAVPECGAPVPFTDSPKNPPLSCLRDLGHTGDHQ